MKTLKWRKRDDGIWWDVRYDNSSKCNSFLNMNHNVKQIIVTSDYSAIVKMGA